MHTSLNGLPRSEERLTVDEAIAVVGLAAVGVDGHVEDAELADLDGACASLGMRDGGVDLMRLCGLFETAGADAVLGTALDTIPAGDRVQALRLALLVVAADGTIPDDEMAFIHELQEYAGLSDDEYHAVLDELFPD